MLRNLRSNSRRRRERYFYSESEILKDAWATATRQFIWHRRQVASAAAVRGEIVDPREIF